MSDITCNILYSKNGAGAGENVQKLGALTVLAEDLVLIPGTHMVGTNHHNSRYRLSHAVLRVPKAPSIHTCRQNIQTSHTTMNKSDVEKC